VRGASETTRRIPKPPKSHCSTDPGMGPTIITEVCVQCGGQGLPHEPHAALPVHRAYISRYIRRSVPNVPMYLLPSAANMRIHGSISANNVAKQIALKCWIAAGSDGEEQTYVSCDGS